MNITIAGSDYTAGLDMARPLTIERKLNEPSVCRMWLTLQAGGALGTPLRNQSVAVTGDDGTVYFTGYLAVSPLPEYAGMGLTGPVFRLALEAVSDEVLLDTQLIPPSAGTTGLTVGQIVQGLVTRTGLGTLLTTGLSLAAPVSQFVPGAGAKWSALAGQASAQGRAAYRAVSGTLSLAQVGSTVHALNEASGTLELANLAFTQSGSQTGTGAAARALANDVTVCGEEEPVAYVTEYFVGDGTTLVFPLSERPFSGPAAREKIIWELFQEPEIDLRYWGYGAGGAYYSITRAGLTIDGGKGVDGDAPFAWLDAVEAGGTLLLEAAGVVLSPGSTGTLAAVFSGAIETSNCIAGFAVKAAEGTGAVSIAPLVQGAVAGPTYALTAGSQYTLRMRIYCPEVERIDQWYRVAGDDGLVAYGGGTTTAQGRIEMEIEQFVDGVGSTPVVLYDGAAGYLPVTYTVAAASSVNLIGTIRSFFLKGLGTGWVSSTIPGGTAKTRRIGTLVDGGECHLTGSSEGGGTLTFYTGNAPVMGEVVAVNYRTVGRAVGRAVNLASQAALAAAGSPATAVWIGSVTEPACRSSQDCRNAATALVAAASSVSAAWSGAYKTSNVALRLAGGASGDVWPGDALLLESASLDLDVQVAVRAVILSYLATSPDFVGYSIAFSNDWANDLSIKTSRTVPGDAWLPAAVSPTYLANLTLLAVTEISATAVSVAAGVTPPSGGGFEVRRRDFAFGLSTGAGTDVDLVMRSAAANFDIPRATEADRFYIRMYDGNTPANYSEFSVGLFLNLPLSTTV